MTASIGAKMNTSNPPAWRFYGILIVLTVLPIGIALTGNPGGPYLAAYISTALVMYGVYEAFSRFRRKVTIGRVWFVLLAGIITGLFVDLATNLGPGLYLGFLVGQAMTVAIILWLIRNTKGEK